MVNEDIHSLILNTIKSIACTNTGYCQINLQSESAQLMIADAICESIDDHIKNLIPYLIKNFPLLLSQILLKVAVVQGQRD